MAEEGGEDGAGAKGEEAKPPANEKDGVEVTIDAVGKGEEEGAREKAYAGRKGAQEDATIEEFFSEGEENANEEANGEDEAFGGFGKEEDKGEIILDIGGIKNAVD